MSIFPLTVGQDVKTVPCRFQDGRFYLKKKLSFLMSGLAERRLCQDVEAVEDDEKVLLFHEMSPIKKVTTDMKLKHHFVFPFYRW